MGTCTSIKNSNYMIISTENTNRICIICQEKISDELFAKCLICNIDYHKLCLHEWINRTTKTYCKCCHCQSIGTLVIYC